MKLLLDQNLSYRLLARIERAFPGSTQVHRLGLEHADDETLWEVAKQQGFTIVTKDSDFPDMSLVRGFPPQVLWLKCGNTSTEHVAHLLLASEAAIREFGTDGTAACLEIY
ncbi:MAG: DUF5615 family PIN-like protein [Thermoanaerobaculia bacterium]|nr:DUF5615 family PIN-like protein [Thermoanaerobaculia bacterium]